MTGAVLGKGYDESTTDDTTDPLFDGLEQPVRPHILVEFRPTFWDGWRAGWSPIPAARSRHDARALRDPVWRLEEKRFGEGFPSSAIA